MFRSQLFLGFRPFSPPLEPLGVVPLGKPGLIVEVRRVEVGAA